MNRYCAIKIGQQFVVLDRETGKAVTKELLSRKRANAIAKIRNESLTCRTSAT